MPSQYTLALLLHAAGVSAGALALCSLRASAAQKQNLRRHGAGQCRRERACMGMGRQHALALLVLAQGYLCLVWLATYSIASYVPNFLFRTRLTPEQQACTPLSRILPRARTRLALLTPNDHCSSHVHAFARQVWLTNETLQIMHRNGLRVPNLRVHDTLDALDGVAIAPNTGHDTVMGYWQKQLPNTRTHIHLSPELRTGPALLYVLSHELAHEHHYQCNNSWRFFFDLALSRWLAPSFEQAVEGHVDRVGMFLLARTCRHDPLTSLQGFLDINSEARASTAYSRLALDVERARAYADAACAGGQAADAREAKPAAFDYGLCPGGGVLRELRVQ